MKRYKVTHIMNTKQLGLMLVAGLLSFGASAEVDLNPDAVLVRAKCRYCNARK